MMILFPQPKPYRAMTNTERQRLFRQRHPGYYGRLHRQRKAKIDALLAARQTEQCIVVAEPVKTLLALPAPAVVFNFPGVNTIPAIPVERGVAETIAVEAK